MVGLDRYVDRRAGDQQQGERGAVERELAELSCVSNEWTTCAGW